MSYKFKSLIAATLLTAIGATAAQADDKTSTVLVQFQLDATDASGKALTQFFDGILPATLTHNGNQSAQYFVNQDDPSKILLLEKWDSKEAFDAYLKWRVEKGDFSTLKSLLEADPIVTFFKG